MECPARAGSSVGWSGSRLPGEPEVLGVQPGASLHRDAVLSRRSGERSSPGVPSQDELLRRLSDHEDRLTERKSEGVSARDLRRALVGFANSVPRDHTAVLYVGLGFA